MLITSLQQRGMQSQSQRCMARQSGGCSIQSLPLQTIHINVELCSSIGAFKYYSSMFSRVAIGQLEYWTSMATRFHKRSMRSQIILMHDKDTYQKCWAIANF